MGGRHEGLGLPGPPAPSPAPARANTQGIRLGGRPHAPTAFRARATPSQRSITLQMALTAATTPHPQHTHQEVPPQVPSLLRLLLTWSSSSARILALQAAPPWHAWSYTRHRAFSSKQAYMYIHARLQERAPAVRGCRSHLAPCRVNPQPSTPVTNARVPGPLKHKGT